MARQTQLDLLPGVIRKLTDKNFGFLEGNYILKYPTSRNGTLA